MTTYAPPRASQDRAARNGEGAGVRALTRLAVVGAFLSAALAATLLARPEPARDPQGRLAVVVSSEAGRGLDRADRLPAALDQLGDAADGDRPSRVAARPEPLERRRQVTVVMSGDLLWHNSVWQSAHEDAVRRGLHERYDFDPMFAAMKPVVQRADVAICHEEVP